MEMSVIKQIPMGYAYLLIWKVELMQWYCANGNYEIASLICLLIEMISHEFGIFKKKPLDNICSKYACICVIDARWLQINLLGQKNETHSNDNEYADTYRLRDHCQLVIVCSCISLMISLLFRGKNKAHEIILFTVRVQIHHYKQPYYTGLHNQIWWSQSNLGKD